MINTNMDLYDLLSRHDQGDFVRTTAEAVLQLIMETNGECTPWRDGYRALGTRVGTLNLRVQKLRHGSYFPGFVKA